MASIRILRNKVTDSRREFRRALARFNKVLAKYAAARRAIGLPVLPAKFHKGNC